MRLASLAILLLLVLASFAGTGRAAADAPRWTVGDFWEYGVETHVEGGVILNGTVRATVSDFGTRAVKGVTVDLFTTLLSGGGSVRGPAGVGNLTGEWSYAGEEWVDAGSYKVVRSVFQIDATGMDPPFGFSFLVQNTSEHEVLSDTWRYPIEVGATGVLVTNTTATERVRIRYGLFTMDSEGTTTYERTISLYAANESEVRVAAGTFPSLEVDLVWANGAVDLWFYAPSVGNNVRTESYDDANMRIAASSLRAFRYQAGESRFLFGLSPPLAAGLIGGIVAGAAVGVVLVLRRRRRTPTARDARDEAPRPPGPT